jgi:Protein of unknown function (DUF1360)
MFYLFLINSLAVWRLSHLLSEENGPFDLSFKLRKAVGVGFFGSLLNCFYCCSIWVAFPFALFLGNSWVEKFVLWLAISGAACLAEKATTKNQETKKAEYFED